MDIAFALLPTTGYGFQIYTLRATANADGFSPLISLLLLVANLMRLVFWYLKSFDSVLMYQSLVMIAMQFVVLYVVCGISKTGTYSCERDCKPLHSFLSHYNVNTIRGTAIACAIFFVTVLCVSLSMVSIPLSADVVGVASVAAEALLAAPQATRNRSRGSTDGLSIPLVLTWAAGDTYKLFFCWSKGVGGCPVQFLACAVVQIIVDAVVLWQVVTLPTTPTEPNSQYGSIEMSEMSAVI